MNKIGANGAAVALILIVILIIAILLFSHPGVISASGLPLLGSTQKANTTLSYSVTSSVSPSSIAPGSSGTVLFTYLNPFDEPVGTSVDFTLNSPAYISVSNPSQQITMPAKMETPSSISFQVSCSSSSPAVSSSSVFTIESSDYWQNATSSVIIYPYNTPSSLVPQEIYSVQSGFMSLSVSPFEIQTVSTASAPYTQSYNTYIYLSPSVYSGEPYVSISSGLPDDKISQIIISVSNQSGAIESASVYYNGNTLSLTANKNGILSTVLTNVPIDLISSGIPLSITAFNNLNKPTQNLINVDVNYNYYYQVSGPSVYCS
ncbi:MAG: hypothetical protein RAK22_02735 [Nanoarchaeota archaeon]|nr:hypothetical protein [Nanoarchaeota archaeon]